MKKIYIGALVVLVGLLAVWRIVTQEPSHDRDWYEYHGRIADTAISSTTVTLYNVRDWNHSTTDVLDRTWHDQVNIQLTDVESVWLGISRLGEIEASGHTFLSFELRDGQVYTLSIEARREVGEQYSTFKGIFNQYELWYGWGTERDFLSASLFLLDRPLEYHRLTLTPKEAQAVLVAVARETSAISDNPRFYNTLSANCTNLLAKAVNASYPDRLPYNISWNLPGKSLSYLHEENLVDQTISIEKHATQAVVDRYDPTLLATSSSTPQDFSATLRTQLNTK